jgi:hypothetical protein
LTPIVLPPGSAPGRPHELIGPLQLDDGPGVEL